MAYRGLQSFIRELEQERELYRISPFSDPVLEISEITDRISKNGGKALLFENTGTSFPLLINAYGSEKRLSLALGGREPEESAKEIDSLFEMLTSSGGIAKKISSVPRFLKVASLMPNRSSRRGICQEVIHRDPDLGILPVLKCWPHDGGRFITLPMVHTVHPVTGKTNVGMYRMQILDKKTTAMHWQRHKTGANHFEAWKASKRKMPVSVALGGDPVYAWSATAPLPEDINEYILAGFLRKKRVSLVKCITNDIYVPEDADIVIEGYVDPSEEPVWEGPFGDHTGFYSLADWYPRFHVTCITHSRTAVYPATIVGIPPMEDAWLAVATEKIFLSPVKLALSPEILDFHMPVAGTAHNLVIVKIRKTYPGQGMKVVNSLMGAGQMMFSKYIVVISSNTDIRDYRAVAHDVFSNFNPAGDIIFTKGPLDVLDHASDNFSFGGKAGIDATEKLREEDPLPPEGGIITAWEDENPLPPEGGIISAWEEEDPLPPKGGKISAWEEVLPPEGGIITAWNRNLISAGILIVSVDQAGNRNAVSETVNYFSGKPCPKIVLVVDSTVDVSDYFMVAWQVLANSDPLRDHRLLSGTTLLIDGTAKVYRKGGFPRKWPNPVCSDEATVAVVDKKWNSYGIGDFIQSPSLKYRSLLQPGKDEVIVKP